MSPRRANPLRGAAPRGPGRGRRGVGVCLRRPAASHLPVSRGARCHGAHAERNRLRVTVPADPDRCLIDRRRRRKLPSTGGLQATDHTADGLQVTVLFRRHLGGEGHRPDHARIAETRRTHFSVLRAAIATSSRVGMLGRNAPPRPQPWLAAISAARNPAAVASSAVSMSSWVIAALMYQWWLGWNKVPQRVVSV